jgi:hypothetical protein
MRFHDLLAFFALLFLFQAKESANPLPGRQSIPVSTLHPRIYVRHDDARLGRGLTVSQLRRRVQDPAYAAWRRGVSGESPAVAVERANRFLEEGNREDLEAVRGILLRHTYSYAQHDVEGFLAGAEMATALDWIYQGLSENERQTALKNIVTTADSSLDFLLHGDPDVNHNYTYMALRTVGVCGLVLKGEGEPYSRKADEYLALTEEWLNGPGKVLDTWKAREGAWGEGSHYTFHETLRNLVLLLQAYRSATDRDYFRTISRNYGDFLAQAGHFLVASTRPDLVFEPTGDCSPSRVLPTTTVPVTLEAMAAGLSDSKEAGRLRSFVSELLQAYQSQSLHPAFDWGMRVFHDPQASVSPSFRTYPLITRHGAGTYEQVVFRNGWDAGSTQITLVAGDHYTDHQHFDKGQFLIYHRGGLALDSGAYDSMYKPDSHWTNYACRTLAHNCLLAYDPQEVLVSGYSPDGGQSILRGLQHHGDWLTYQAHFRKEGLDTGTVLAYDSAPELGYGYVRCDLSRAYGKKLSWYDRQLVYLPTADYLVIYDRAVAEKSSTMMSWLLHFQERPLIDGTAPEPGVQRFPQAQLTQVKRQSSRTFSGRTLLDDGSLIVCSLLPEDRILTTVGGEGYEFYNSFENRNYPLSRPRNGELPREPGRWRIEVAPSHPLREQQFLNVIQIGDASSMAPLAVASVRDEQKKLVGVQIQTPKEAQVILFANDQSQSPVRLPVTYEINVASPARHLLVEMLSLQSVIVEVNGQSLGRHRTGDRGVLSFRDNITGRRKVVIRPSSEKPVVPSPLQMERIRRYAR